MPAASPASSNGAVDRSKHCHSAAHVKEPRPKVDFYSWKMDFTTELPGPYGGLGGEGAAHHSAMPAASSNDVKKL